MNAHTKAEAAGRILDVIEEKLELIGAEEQFAPSNVINAEKGLVTSTFSFKRDREAKERYKKTVVFDFSNVSQEKLLDLALYEVKQKVQNLLRAVDPEDMILKKTYARVDVQSVIVEAEKRQGSGKEMLDLVKMARAGGLNPEKLRELIAAATGGAAEAKEPAPKASGPKGRKAA